MRRQRPSDHPSTPSPPPESTWNGRGGQPSSIPLLPRPPAASMEPDLCGSHLSLCPELLCVASPKTTRAARMFHTNSFHTSFILLKKEDKTSRFRVHSSPPTLHPLLANRRHLGWEVGNGGVRGWEKPLVEGKVRCGPF